MSTESIETKIIDTLTDLIHREGIDNPRIVLKVPRNRAFGNLSSNIALVVSKQLGIPSRKLAEKIASQYPSSSEEVQKVDVEGPGFLNFHLAPAYYHRLLKEVIKLRNHFGDSDEGGGERWHFEFISANPTGPVNIVSARAASVGDTMVRIFNKRGYKAHSEYYVNDGGGQIRKFGASLRARLEQIDTGAETAVIPDGGYQGEYVLDLAREWRRENPELPPLQNDGDVQLFDDRLGLWAAERIRREQESTLKRFRVGFDVWFRESELNKVTNIYNDGIVDRYFPTSVIEDLKSRDLTYEKDGALWFKAGDFGDSEDRVVKTSLGNLTYIVPDVAYHLRKFNHFAKAVNLLGPDHHGHILQLNAALKALLGAEKLKSFFFPIIVQQVNLKQDGKEVTMSKRAGVGIILDELIEEVGVDAARFFFLRRKITSHLDFDINLARKHSDENPVYYIQYAHARIRSILRQPDAFDPDENVDLGLLTEPEEEEILHNIVKFPWTLTSIVRSIDPHPLTSCLIDLARAFHQFYTKHRVIGENQELTAARLILCNAVAIVLNEGLRLMGVSSPDKM